MNNELEDLRQRMKDLIIGTCNTVGCKDCPYKFPKDEDGNTCQSGFLQQQISAIELN